MANKFQKKKQIRLEKFKEKRHKNHQKNQPNEGINPDGSVVMEDVSQQNRKGRRSEEHKQHQNSARQKQLNQARNLSELVSQAESETLEYEQQQIENTDEELKTFHKKSLKGYHKEFNKVVDEADIILQVLDARDPIGTRCMQVEQAIVNSGTSKKLVLVLNKIDLVPKDNLLAWINYLRKQFPTIPFKSSTQVQSRKLVGNKMSVEKATSLTLKTSTGVNLLMKIIGNYCRNQGNNFSVTVGVVGYPNVGKSSLINSLNRSRSCSVGGVPGMTKNLQKISLTSNIKIIDSPGVVLQNEANQPLEVLRNAIKVEALEDPITPVEEIIKKITPEQINSFYDISENFTSSHDILKTIAKKMGRLRKGGIPDVEAAARKLLNDWNQGKIKYFTVPPENTHHLESEIASEAYEGINMDYFTEILEEIENLPGDKPEKISFSAHVPKREKIETETKVSEKEKTKKNKDDWEEVNSSIQLPRTKGSLKTLMKIKKKNLKKEKKNIIKTKKINEEQLSDLVDNLWPTFSVNEE